MSAAVRKAPERPAQVAVVGGGALCQVCKLLTPWPAMPVTARAMVRWLEFVQEDHAECQLPGRVGRAAQAGKKAGGSVDG